MEQLRPVLTLCAYALGVFLFSAPEIITRMRKTKGHLPRKQYLFNEPVAFERQRYALLVFLISFFGAWNAVYFRWLPTQMTYDVVFGPVVVAGCGWFVLIFLNTHRKLGWDKSKKLIVSLCLLWMLANLVDLSLIKLGAWNFNKRTTLGIIPFRYILENDVFGNPIQVPYVEIFGFNLFISWFILFVQMFINDLIKSPSSWKKLLSFRSNKSLTPAVDAIGQQANNPLIAVCQAAQDYNVRALEGALDRLFQSLSQGFPLLEKDINGLLDSLRKKRLFFQMQRVCEVLFKNNFVYPVVLGQMAQARIDQGNPHSAPFYLQQINLDLLQETKEWKESQGLFGRTYKQCYVNLGEKDQRAESYLLLALEHYRAIYLKDNREYWHGINFVACTARGQRDKLKNKAFSLNWKKSAQDILDYIEKTNKEELDRDPWKLATCLEACVALDNPAKAMEWAQRYVNCDDEHADVFEFSSTYRQLVEVWQLEKQPEFAEVLNLLRQAILDKPGGKITFRKEDLQRTKGMILIEPMENAAKGLIRVERGDGTPVGSGFLVTGKSISEKWQKYPVVFVTANHVLDSIDRSMRPEDAFLNFYSGGAKGRPHQKLWSSPDLDVAVFTINETGTSTAFSVCQLQERELDLIPNQSQIFILGYPLGDQLQINCSNNYFVGCTPTYIRYKTQTWPGSSGSPVLDENWKVIGVHTEASTGEDTNQGVNFEAVVKAVNGGP